MWWRVFQTPEDAGEVRMLAASCLMMPNTKSFKLPRDPRLEGLMNGSMPETCQKGEKEI